MRISDTIRLEQISYSDKPKLYFDRNRLIPGTPSKISPINNMFFHFHLCIIQHSSPLLENNCVLLHFFQHDFLPHNCSCIIHEIPIRYGLHQFAYGSRVIKNRCALICFLLKKQTIYHRNNILCEQQSFGGADAFYL